jgi:hypothetical protein
MNAKKTFWVGAALAGALAVMTGGSGCSDDDEKTAVPATATAEAGPSCTAGAKECVNPRLARVCPSDGSGWLSVSCAVGELCAAGECKIDPNAACPAGAATCLNESTALRCKPDQKGYEQVTCPSGTTCQGQGLCGGGCIVGSSICLDSGTVGTCNDGKSFTPNACASDQACVRTAELPMKQAACKAAECHPQPNGCVSVCGDATNPSADPAKAISTCAETPNGWKWTVTPCTGAATCNPAASQCATANPGMHLFEAACTTECTAGATRCVNLGGKSAVQTCGADGKWGSVANCNAGEGCATAPNNPSLARCVDAPCAVTNSTGVCVGDRIKACDQNGRLAQTAADCAIGTCLQLSAGTGLEAPGTCVEQCKAGDERCVSNGSTQFQTCQNGKWSGTSTCPAIDAAPALCFSYVNASGRPAKVCGAECSPGQSRCASGDGGAVSDEVQTCDATGHWATPTACSVGKCLASGNRATCVADCVPGTTVCVGANRAVTGTPYTGRDGFGTCTSNGLLPTTGTTTCGAGLACRMVKGQAVVVSGNACLECIGTTVTSGNEDGFADTRCSNVAGDAGGGQAAQTCGANNAWVGGAVADCSSLGRSCVSGSAGSVNKVDSCQFRNGHYRSESYYASPRPFHGPTTCTCAGHYCNNYGAPTVCGAVPDCCGNSCSRASQGTPARCN